MNRRSQPQELNGQAAKKDGCTGYSVSEALQPGQWNKTHSRPGKKNYTKHGAKRNYAKHARYHHQAKETVLRSRIHQDGNQRFTGAKNENDKQRPGRNTRLGSVVVNVGVLPMMAVRVCVQPRSCECDCARAAASDTPAAIPTPNTPARMR